MNNKNIVFSVMLPCTVKLVRSSPSSFLSLACKVIECDAVVHIETNACHCSSLYPFPSLSCYSLSSPYFAAIFFPSHPFSLSAVRFFVPPLSSLPPVTTIELLCPVCPSLSSDDFPFSPPLCSVLTHVLSFLPHLSLVRYLWSSLFPSISIPVSHSLPPATIIFPPLHRLVPQF